VRHYNLRHVVQGVSYNGSRFPASFVDIQPGSYLSLQAVSRPSPHPGRRVPIRREQRIFDNNVAAPSNLTMPSYGTVNAGLTTPFKHCELILNALNILNKQLYSSTCMVASGLLIGTRFWRLRTRVPGLHRHSLWRRESSLLAKERTARQPAALERTKGYVAFVPA